MKFNIEIKFFFFIELYYFIFLFVNKNQPFFLELNSKKIKIMYHEKLFLISIPLAIKIKVTYITKVFINC